MYCFPPNILVACCDCLMLVRPMSVYVYMPAAVAAATGGIKLASVLLGSKRQFPGDLLLSNTLSLLKRCSFLSRYQ